MWLVWENTDDWLKLTFIEEIIVQVWKKHETSVVIKLNIFVLILSIISFGGFGRDANK